jgi:hypothetical protein
VLPVYGYQTVTDSLIILFSLGTHEHRRFSPLCIFMGTGDGGHVSAGPTDTLRLSLKIVRNRSALALADDCKMVECKPNQYC